MLASSAEVLAPGRLALVAFGASWCGPCGLMAPALRALAAIEKDRLMVAKLDAEANPETADALRPSTTTRPASCSGPASRSPGSTATCRCARSRPPRSGPDLDAP